MASESESSKVKLLRQGAPEVITSAERRMSDILVVEPENQEREIIRNALIACDYARIHVAADHAAGLKVLENRHFTHLIFCAKTTTMPASEFIAKVLDMSPQLIAIAASYTPNADDVFNLLRLGARGFLVKPYNIASLDSAITLATTGAPLPDVVLHSPNRNDAFATLLASNLDRYALAARQARTFGTAQRDLKKHRSRLENVSRIAQMFAQNSHESLLGSIVNLFIALAEGPATRLGRLRGKLRKERVKASN